jgi:hypothetical protein
VVQQPLARGDEEEDEDDEEDGWHARCQSSDF